MTCEHCALEQRVSELEKDMQRNSEQHKEFYNRLGQLENSEARTDEKYNNIMRKIEEMSKVLEELRAAPGKKWESTVMTVIAAIVGALVGHFL